MVRKPKIPSVEDRLDLRYVPIETVRQWERNAKKHDFGGIWESIKRFGFKDPPKFEPKLNGGEGGVVEGNGRSHALVEMKSANEPPPRGIVAEGDSWLMPVLFGVDAESERVAEAYGLTHNNLTLSGGDFGPLETQRMHEEIRYITLLADLAPHGELPVGTDEDDLSAMIERLAPDEKKSVGGDYDSFSQNQELVGKSGNTEQKMEQFEFGVFIACEGEGEQAEMIQRLRDEGYDAVAKGSKPPGVKR